MTTDDRVLAFLHREADMDGLVTTVHREIAAAAEVSLPTVRRSLSRLESVGVLRVETRGHGRSQLHPGTAHTGRIQLLDPA